MRILTILLQWCVQLNESRLRSCRICIKVCTTVEPRYNEVLGTMKFTLLYQVSHYIRVKKQRNIKSWELPIQFWSPTNHLHVCRWNSFVHKNSSCCQTGNERLYPLIFCNAWNFKILKFHRTVTCKHSLQSLCTRTHPSEQAHPTDGSETPKQHSMNLKCTADPWKLWNFSHEKEAHGPVFWPMKENSIIHMALSILAKIHNSEQKEDEQQFCERIFFHHVVIRHTPFHTEQKFMHCEQDLWLLITSWTPRLEKILHMWTMEEHFLWI